jgi:hypothetical protein
LRKRLVFNAVGAGLLLAAIGGGGVVVVEWALRPPRRELLPNHERTAAALAENNGADLEEVSFAAADGAVLRGWLFAPRTAAEKGVLLLHGVSDSRVGTLAYAPIFLSRGYAVLCPDARAHGRSGGERAFYGAREAEEVRGWVDLLLAKTGAKRLFGLGESMGGAILLQSLRSEDRFEALVAESAFSTLEESSFDYLGRPFGAGPWLGRTLLRGIPLAGGLYARIRYGVDLGRASAEKAVASTSVPVLLIHGLADENIPVRHSRRLQSLNPAHVQLWEVPGAGHCGALGAARAEFEERVVGWFEGKRDGGAETREGPAPDEPR